MDTLQQKAVEEYKTADKSGKALLESIFGSKIFVPNIMEQIKTLEDACTLKGINPAVFKKIPLALSKIQGLPCTDADLLEIQTREEMAFIIKVINQGWKANPKDGSQKKWYAWYKSDGSGFVFTRTFYDLTYTDAGLGSRFYLETEEKARYVYTQFVEKMKIIHQYK